MKIVDIVDITGGKVICGHDQTDKEIQHAFSSDLLSDVFTINIVALWWFGYESGKNQLKMCRK